MTTRGQFALSGIGAACWVSAVITYALVLLTGDGWLLAVVAAASMLPMVDLAFGCRGGGVRLVRPTRAVAGGLTPVQLVRTPGAGAEGDLVATLFPAGVAVRGRVHAGCDAATVAIAAGARGPMPPMRWMADTYGPLGLAARRRHGVDASPVLVHPAAAEPLPALLDGAEAGGVRASAAAGPVPAGVRAYRAGDAARAVHWRSTARRGAPVVREWTGEAGHGLVVAAGAYGPQDEPMLIRAAATVVGALDRGVAVTLLTAGEALHPATVMEALDWFALLLPAPPPVLPATVSADGVLWIGAATNRPAG